MTIPRNSIEQPARSDARRHRRSDSWSGQFCKFRSWAQGWNIAEWHRKSSGEHARCSQKQACTEPFGERGSLLRRKAKPTSPTVSRRQAEGQAQKQFSLANCKALTFRLHVLAMLQACLHAFYPCASMLLNSLTSRCACKSLITSHERDAQMSDSVLFLLPSIGRRLRRQPFDRPHKLDKKGAAECNEPCKQQHMLRRAHGGGKQELCRCGDVESFERVTQSISGVACMFYHLP